MKCMFLASALILLTVTSTSAETRIFPNSARMATVAGIELTSAQHSKFIAANLAILMRFICAKDQISAATR
jgi:hypothetical protein